jgi:adenine phosphoribosyltransferase
MDLKQYIRDVPDFPEPGILFKDITPILQHPAAFSYVIQQLHERFRGESLDVIVAVESRGFLFGAPLAHQMGKPLVPVRKQGKLPSSTYTAEYTLEYGSSIMEIHTDGVQEGQRALLIDDVLATGGTLGATAKLVELSGGTVAGIGLAIELAFLGGREHLKSYDIFSLVQY